MKNVLASPAAVMIVAIGLSACGFDDIKNNPSTTPIPPLFFLLQAMRAGPWGTRSRCCLRRMAV